MSSIISGKTVYNFPQYRFPGGGFIQGSAADQISRSPVGQNVNNCAISCAEEPECKQYTADLDISGNSYFCSLFRNAYAYNAEDPRQYPQPDYTSGYVVAYPINLYNSWNGNNFTITCNPNGTNFITDIAINVGSTRLLDWTPMTANSTTSVFYTVTNANSSNTQYTIIVRNRLPIGTTSNTIQGTIPLAPTYKGSEWVSSSILQVRWDNKGSKSMVSIYAGDTASGTPIATQDVPNGSTSFSGLSLTNTYTVMIYNYADLDNNQAGRLVSNGFSLPIVYTPPASGSPVPVITSLGGSVINVLYNNARNGSDSSGISNPRYVNNASECAAQAKEAGGKQYILSNNSICYVFSNSFNIDFTNTSQWNPTDPASLPNSYKSGYIVTISQPSNVAATGSANTLRIEWTNPSASISLGYRITYSKVSAMGDPVVPANSQTINTQQNNYIISGVDYNSIYGYYVQTTVSTSDGNISLSAPTTTQYVESGFLSSPIPATITSVIAGDGNVVVSWTAQQIAETSITLYYDTEPITFNSSGISNSPKIDNISITSTSQLVTGLTNGNLYRFAIVTSNPIGISAPSNILSTSPVPSLIPPSSAPTLGAPVIGDQKVNLSWNAVLNASKYIVYYSTTSPVTFSSPSLEVQGITAEITGLTNGTLYYFAVVASNGAGNSSLSSLRSGSPITSPPAAPTGLVATFGNGRGSLTWNSVPSAVTYKVYLGTVFPLTEDNLLATTSNNSYMFENLINGTHYYATIVAVNSSGQASPIPPAADITPVSTIPLTPTNLNISTTVSNFVVTWDTVEGAESYNFYYAKNPNMTADLKIITVSNGTLTQSSPASTSYWSYVTAVNGDGQESIPSPIVTFSTLTPASDPPSVIPSVPTNLKVVPGENYATVSWSLSANSSTYSVFYSTDEAFVRNVLNVNSATTSVMVPNLKPNTLYYFNVTGVNGVGHSDPSSIVSARTTPKTVIPEDKTGKLKRYLKSYWILIVLLLIVLGTGLYFKFGRKPA